MCVLGPGGSVCISHRYSLERRARGSDGTRGRDCQAGQCPRAETWPEGRINGSACVECYLFLLPPPRPLQQANSFRCVKCLKGTWGKCFYLKPWVSLAQLRQVFWRNLSVQHQLALIVQL